MWRPGKIFTRNGRRGRYWYWNGSKKSRRFQMKKPTHNTPRNTSFIDRHARR